ncbi:MAG: hypothetical protein WBM07_16610, partial [Chitinivibrionales bacterium]
VGFGQTQQPRHSQQRVSGADASILFLSNNVRNSISKTGPLRKHSDQGQSALASKKLVRLSNDEFCRLWHDTFRVNGFCCFLVNCFSLLIYPKNDQFAIIFLTDLGINDPPKL